MRDVTRLAQVCDHHRTLPPDQVHRLGSRQPRHHRQVRVGPGEPGVARGVEKALRVCLVSHDRELRRQLVAGSPGGGVARVGAERALVAEVSMVQRRDAALRRLLRAEVEPGGVLTCSPEVGKREGN